jgi:hypothetical protein
MKQPWVKPRVHKFSYDTSLHVMAPSDGPLAVMATMKRILDYKR